MPFYLLNLKFKKKIIKIQDWIKHVLINYLKYFQSYLMWQFLFILALSSQFAGKNADMSLIILIDWRGEDLNLVALINFMPVFEILVDSSLMLAISWTHFQFLCLGFNWSKRFLRFSPFSSSNLCSSLIYLWFCSII